MRDEIKIYVIIVTYKGKRWYDKCFVSLRESTIPVQTIVVDNTPGDEDAEYIKAHYPEGNIIKPEENLGFGRANNLGMRYALDNGCDYVFLLNQDAWIEPYAIEKLVAISKHHPEFGILSPMHMNAEMNQINMMYYDYNHNCDLVNDLYNHTFKSYYPMRYVNAAAWLMTRKTLETIGGFCPMFDMYGEDDDYLNRMYYHKVPIVLCPDARIVHDTREFLSEQGSYQVKASVQHFGEHLDINHPFMYRQYCYTYIKRYLRAKFGGDARKANRIKEEYKVLIHNRAKIESCRQAHMKQQSNWL